ncbi:MAG: arabinan endo-1,5-alpha-L-arabinosidase, partial [Bacteroidales bacterium]|nr:arabinan endo-1,5-alpha-L-arabinosidase [Bacteroidales bacterium]
GGGTVVAAGNDRFPGAGHCAVVSTPEGEKMLLHAYDREDGYNARLLVRSVRWDRDGWPSIEL